MPCYVDDSYEREQNARYLEKRVKQFEAVVCAVMRVDPTIVDRIDWNECGVTKKQHMAWWKEHQKQDAERKIREEEEKKQEAIRKEKKRLKEIRALERKLAELKAQTEEKA